MKPKFKEQHEDLAPPPIIINKEEEYEVEEVSKYRKWGRTQYLIYWKEYGDEHDQWIVESGLPHAKDTIEDY